MDSVDIIHGLSRYFHGPEFQCPWDNINCVHGRAVKVSFMVHCLEKLIIHVFCSCNRVVPSCLLSMTGFLDFLYGESFLIGDCPGFKRHAFGPLQADLPFRYLSGLESTAAQLLDSWLLGF